MPSVVDLVTSAIKLAVLLLGEHYAAQWVAAGRLWWHRMAEASLKAQADAWFQGMDAGWKRLADDRGPLRPPPE